MAEQFSATEQAAPSFVLSCIEGIELLAHRNASLDLYAIFGTRTEPPQGDVDRLVATLREGECCYGALVLKWRQQENT